MAHKILIIEDDPQILKALKMNLTYSGYQVLTAETLESATKKLSEVSFDAILLDINLPDGNGLEYYHEIRGQEIETPILFISARTDEETVVKAMNIGADDYIRKPFGVEELKARINRIIGKKIDPNILKLGTILIHKGKRQLIINELPIKLSRREFDILLILAEKKGDIVTREHILDYLGLDLDIYDRTIDSHMSHLRRKLKESTKDQVKIQSVYGVGYQLQWENNE